MQTFLYIVKTLFKKRRLLFLVPLAIALIVFVFLSRQPKQYRSSTTLYTGIVSGYDVLSSSSGVQDWMSVNNAVDNLINIVKAESTLENVSLRLLARNLVHCDPGQDNEFLTAESSRELKEQTPKEVTNLIVPGDEEATYNRFCEFYASDNTNYLKQLFHWNHRHYSFKALSEIEVNRIGNSDMIRISYVSDDQYIVYNTLLLVIDEFIEQYMKIRYQQTNDVVAYFENELRVIRGSLTHMEDSLTMYNVRKGVINYQEQTRMVAERSKELDTSIEQVSRELAGAKENIKVLDEKLGFVQEIYNNNTAFIGQLHRISSLYSDSSSTTLKSEQDRISLSIDKEKQKLTDISREMAASRYSKEGVANDDLIREWMNSLITQVRAEQELAVLKKNRSELDSEFRRFSPVGSSIKRQEREISFCEQNYLSNLQGLNEAKLRQKNLQLTSATFRVLTPPTVPLSAEKTKHALYALIVFALILVLLIVYVIAAELFNRKPYDKQVAQRIIGLPVVGALPIVNKKNNIAQQCEELAYSQLGNTVVNYFDRSKMSNIINVIGMDGTEGKSTVCQALMDYFEKLDTKPVFITHNKDFQMDDKYYLMATSIYDFGITEDNAEALSEAGVIIIEYPPLSLASFPVKLFETSAVTLLVADSTRSWTDMNSIILRQLAINDKDNKLVTVLNKAHKDSVGTFTGMLPPFSLKHKIHFAMWNLGNLTADEGNS